MLQRGFLGEIFGHVGAFRGVARAVGREAKAGATTVRMGLFPDRSASGTAGKEPGEAETERANRGGKNRRPAPANSLRDVSPAGEHPLGLYVSQNYEEEKRE